MGGRRALSHFRHRGLCSARRGVRNVPVEVSHWLRPVFHPSLPDYQVQHAAGTLSRNVNHPLQRLGAHAAIQVLGGSP